MITNNSLLPTQSRIAQSVHPSLLIVLISYFQSLNFRSGIDLFSNKLIGNIQHYCIILYFYALWDITRFIWLKSQNSVFFRVLNRTLSSFLKTKTSAMLNFMTKWCKTGTGLNKNLNYPKRVQAPENIASVEGRLEKRFEKILMLSLYI